MKGNFHLEYINYSFIGQIGIQGARGNDGPQGEEGPQGLAGLPGEMVIFSFIYHFYKDHEIYR